MFAVDDRLAGNPFPGLRPFDQRDSRVFFGRDAQVDRLLERLERDRLIAVVGSSASGKSSLVRAGLLPALHGGHLVREGARWRIVVLRPGGAAIDALVDALESAGLLGDASSVEERRGLARVQLQSGELGLVELVRGARLRADENLLVVVDQFEELFRFRHDRDDAPAFTKLLLAAASARDVPIFVLLTMRSDFLGECSQFRDLPEAIGDSLFLVPRLTRDQLAEAIEGPAGVAGAEISPLLVTQLQNEIGDSPDQLPVLQHALMRTWDLTRTSGSDAGTIGSDEFAATGGLARALSNHGDDVFAALSPQAQAAAERIFRALTDRTTDERGIRRPARFDDLVAITGCAPNAVTEAIEAFRAPGVSFLVPAPPVALEASSVIDISHESLMRVWARCSRWVDDETRAARTYRRLADAADAYASGTGALLVDPALTAAVAWRGGDRPTRAWAERYFPWSFDRAMAYVDASVEQRARERAAAAGSRRRRAFGRTGIAAILVLAALSLAALVAVQRERGEVLAQQSRSLASDAQAAVDRGDAVTGELLALAALPGSIAHPDRPVTQAALDALERAYLSRRELLDLRGHDKPIDRVAWSPDAREVATASRDGTARIWNASTGALVHTIRTDSGYMTSASWSPDGTLFLTSAGDRPTRIWDARTFRQRRALHGYAAYVNTSQWSYDGHRVLTGSFDGGARVWDARTGEPLRVLRVGSRDDGFWNAEFSPDGRFVVTSSYYMGVRIWDVNAGRIIKTLALGTGPEWATFSPDGRHVATAGYDKSVRLWDVASGRQLYAKFDAFSGFVSVAFSPNGRYLVSTSRNAAAQIRDARTGDVLVRLSGFLGRVESAQFSPDGKLLLTGSGDAVARIWNPLPTAPARTLPAARAAVAAAVYAPGDRAIFTAGADGLVRAFTRVGALTWTRRASGALNAVAVSPRGDRVVTAGANGIAQVWDATSGAPQFMFGNARFAGLNAVEFSPDARFIATGSDDKTARLWDAASGAQLRIFRGADWQIESLAFSRDGRRLIGGGEDGTGFVWDVATGRILAHFGGVDNSPYNAVSFSSDGSGILTGSAEQAARLWNSMTGAPLLGFFGHSGALTDARYEPDERRIATASVDGTVRIWNAATGDTVDEFLVAAGDDYPNSARFSSDGRDLLTASTNGATEIWRLPRAPRCQALIDAVRRSVPRELDAEQLHDESIGDTRASPLESAFMAGDACRE